jgi:hypothetical protein
MRESTLVSSLHKNKTRIYEIKEVDGPKSKEVDGPKSMDLVLII